MKIGFAMCGSFCTFSQVFPVMEQLARGHTLVPIFSPAVMATDSRFGTAQAHWQRAAAICGREPVGSIAQAEPQAHAAQRTAMSLDAHLVSSSGLE